MSFASVHVQALSSSPAAERLTADAWPPRPGTPHPLRRRTRCRRRADAAERGGEHSQHEQARHGLTRRQLLGAGLAAGAVAGTGGWRSAGGLMNRAGSRAGTHLPRGLRAPGSRPYPHLPAGTDTIPHIKHIVVLMMENHSYDNHLGMLRRAGADGFTLGPGGKPTAANPYADGRIQHAFRMPNTCQQFGHPSQTWANSHTQFDGGKLRGFVKSGSGPVAMGYWDRSSLPFYYSMASVFPIADRYFCSVLGQTYPNRRYLMAGTSLGLVDDNPLQLVDYPANGTIFDRLHKAGVTWNDYFSPTSPTPTLALFPKLLVRYPSHLAPVSDFLSAAAAGTLPGFSLVEPNYGTSSEENPQDIALGEQFAAKVIDAVMSGPGWPNTLLIWTFDEHGGYYDHVVPPPALARTPSRPTPAAGRPTTGSPSTASGCRARSSPPGPGGTTCPTGCSTTPASWRSSKPSGTWPR
jgi:phospholipase C